MFRSSATIQRFPWVDNSPQTIHVRSMIDQAEVFCAGKKLTGSAYVRGVALNAVRLWATTSFKMHPERSETVTPYADAPDMVVTVAKAVHRALDANDYRLAGLMGGVVMISNGSDKQSSTKHTSMLLGDEIGYWLDRHGKK